LHRAAIKNVWFIGKQAFDRHPERRKSKIVTDFFHDAPLNAALAQKCLGLCEDMDEARLKRRGVAYEDQSRPSIYPFMETSYCIHRTAALKSISSYGGAM